nr:hypothetical protein Iba_chr01aCG16580 [Ipomoea batatas]
MLATVVGGYGDAAVVAEEMLRWRRWGCGESGRRNLEQRWGVVAGLCRRRWDHGLFLPRRSLGTNRATAAAPTMASPDLPFPGEAELSGGSASGPFRRLRQNRESFPPLVSTTQGSNDWVGIFGRFSKSMVVAAWTLRRRTVAASPSSVSCCSSSRLRLRLTEDEGSFMMD